MTSTTDLSGRDIRQRELVPPDKIAGCHALVIGVGAVDARRRCSLRRRGYPT